MSRPQSSASQRSSNDAAGARGVVEVARRVEISAAPERVRALVQDMPGHADWFPGMERVEALKPDRPGAAAGARGDQARRDGEGGGATPRDEEDGAARRDGENGNAVNTQAIWRFVFVMTALRIRVEEHDATDAAIVWHVTDERGYFDATWTFELEALSPECCAVRLTERRRERSVLGWLWQRLFLRRDHYVRKYLDALTGAAAQGGSADCA